MTISESKTDCLRSAIAGPDVIPNGSATRPADLQAKDIEEVEPPLQKAAPLVKEVSKPLVKINVNEAIKTEGIWVKKGAVALIGGHEFQSTACMSPNHRVIWHQHCAWLSNFLSSTGAIGDLRWEKAPALLR